MLQVLHACAAAVMTEQLRTRLCCTRACVCRPLGMADVQGAALLLTRAFAGTAEAVKFNEAL